MNEFNNNNPVTGVVYLISGDGGVYQGATTRAEERLREHLVALQNNRHWNQDFQQAVNQYGLISFVYLPRDPVPYDKLGEEEQKAHQEAKNAEVPLLSKRRPPAKAHPVGYKLSDKTKRKQSRAKRGNKNAAKRFSFIAPDGRRVEASSLTDLCKTYGLDISCLSRVAHRKQESHRGFRLYEQ
jgi:hypothetical protein